MPSQFRRSNMGYVPDNAAHGERHHCSATIALFYPQKGLSQSGQQSLAWASAPSRLTFPTRANVSQRSGGLPSFWPRLPTLACHLLIP